MHQAVLSFWFEDTYPKSWWTVDPAFDAEVTRRYGALLMQASRGELHQWRDELTGRLAEIIVLDQFSRNIHRNTPLAFANDTMALVLAQEAVRGGSLEALPAVQRTFLLLPYMHSESALIHELAEALYRDHCPAESYQFELKHKAVIDRFGRYPHRNAVLGRASTAEELAFLKQPGSSF